MLSVSVRTQYLQNYSREADSLTDISYLSLAPSGERAGRCALGGQGPLGSGAPCCPNARPGTGTRLSPLHARWLHPVLRPGRLLACTLSRFIVLP